MSTPESQIHYIERPELSETFADSVKFSTLEEEVVRIELCVTRLKNPRKKQTIEAERVPVCRLALTPNAVADLNKQLQNMIDGLVHLGILKPIPVSDDSTQH